MRVKISYSVELDEVPEHIAELIEQEATQLSFCDHLCNEIGELLRQPEPHVIIAAEKIDKVRRNLAALDTRLNESIAILSGYHQAKETPRGPPNAVPAQQVPAPTPPQEE